MPNVYILDGSPYCPNKKYVTKSVLKSGKSARDIEATIVECIVKILKQLCIYYMLPSASSH